MVGRRGEGARIHLRRVEVRSCGPVSSFDEPLAPLTVIYAGNERGKTTLVENILASLFRDPRDRMYPQVRQEFLGASRVTVSGLEGEEVVFTPQDRRTLDSHLSAGQRGLPRSLFHLLFVRGAETGIIPEHGGVSREVLKALLSRQQLYESIRRRLPGEVGYTTLEEGLLVPRRRTGAAKTFGEARAALEALQRASELFHNGLSESEAVRLEASRARLAGELAAQERARRHLAWLLSRRVQSAKRELARSSEAEVEELAEAAREHLRAQQELAARRKELEGCQRVEEDGRWLEAAGQRYERLQTGSGSRLAEKLAFLLTAVLLAASMAAFFLAAPLLPLLLGAAVVAFAAGLLLAFLPNRGRPGGGAAAEGEALREEFRRRFGRPLGSGADFQVARSELDRRAGGCRQSEEQAAAAARRLAGLAAKVREGLAAAGSPETAEERWPQAAAGLRARRRQLEAELAEDRARLEQLGVDPSDYLEDSPGVEYSRAEEERLREEAAAAAQALEQERRRGEEERKALVEHIGLEAAYAGLEEVAEAVASREAELRAQMVDALALMIAGHVVEDALEELRRQEDEELERVLNRAEVAELLRRFTGRYERLGLQGEQLWVGAGQARYQLGSLSTGAREQVLLALRMGVARVLSGSQSLFLILDDAFQYSDWQRRQALVEQAVEIVRDGWQVVYLTMDDDVRDRFLAASEGLPEGAFRLIRL